MILRLNLVKGVSKLNEGLDLNVEAFRALKGFYKSNVAKSGFFRFFLRNFLQK
jgi:hypothetical protein